MKTEDEGPHTLTYGLIVSPDPCTKRFLHVSDTFISLFVITPLVVTHWYGTWVFMDHHPEYFPILETFIFGVIWNTCMVLTKELIHTKMKTTEMEKKSVLKSIFKYIFIKVYVYFFSIGCIMNWRSGFALLEKQFGKCEKISVFFLNVNLFHFNRTSCVHRI